jgi:phage shock protein A
MFKAIGRWIKAIGYLITGRIDEARRAIDSDPAVVRAKFEEIIEEKKKKIRQYKQAVAGLITQQEKKLSKVRELTEEVNKLEKLKAGALAKAKKAVEGKSPEEAKKDETYQKCLAAYNDFNSTLNEKKKRIADLEEDIEGYQKTISQHKIQLEHLVRDLEKLKGELADTVADVVAAKQEKEIADALSGIAEDTTDAELEKLRNLREEIKAEAKISKELAGTDTKVQEAEFLAFAEESEVSSEFDELLGLAASKDKGIEKSDTKKMEESLPE